jgi:hypothetical protein
MRRNCKNQSTDSKDEANFLLPVSALSRGRHVFREVAVGSVS